MMSNSAETYDVVMCCHACRRSFEVYGVEPDKIAWLPIHRFCPYCRAFSKPTGNAAALHRTLGLKKTGP